MDEKTSLYNPSYHETVYFDRVSNGFKNRYYFRNLNVTLIYMCKIPRALSELITIFDNNKRVLNWVEYKPVVQAVIKKFACI